jgi:Ring finger domain
MILSQLEGNASRTTDEIRSTRTHSLLTGDFPSPRHFTFRFYSYVTFLCQKGIFSSQMLLQDLFLWAQIDKRGLVKMTLTALKLIEHLQLPYWDSIYRFLDNAVVSYRCTICWEDISTTGQRGCLPCGHSSFHEVCLTQWKQYKKCCPLCRDRVQQ